MKLEWLLLALLVGILATLGGAIALGEVPDGHGYTDAAFQTLQLGGDGPRRITRILWLGWLFGALQIAFFLACLALGLRRRNPADVGAPPWQRALWLWGAAFEGIWTGLVVVYWRYAAAGSTDLWLGLPSPTAIMLYGIWWFPLVFCGLYVANFDRWVLSEADLARFDDLVAEARTQRDSARSRPADSP